MESQSKPARVRHLPTAGKTINSLTGEELDYVGTVETPVPVRRRKRKLVYALIEPKAMTRLELTQFEAKVFWQIADHVNRDDQNRSFVRTTEIARAIDALPQNVSRTLRDLKARRIIFSLGPSAWRINSWITWRGDSGEWAEHLDPSPDWSR